MYSSDERYFMEDPREAQRLIAKVNASEWVTRYFEHYLADAQDILDVGCGPGIIAAEIARRKPEAHIVGLDSSAQRAQVAEQYLDSVPNGEFRLGLAQHIPAADDSFDFVYCRFMLEYLPDPQAAVAEMARVCRPGGTVVLQDLDGQLLWHYPEDATLQEMIDTVVRSLAATGFDPLVGRKLFHFARCAGLRDIATSIDSYHLVAGAIDEQNFELWAQKLDIALPAMVKALGCRPAAEQLKTRFLEYLKRPDTFSYSVLMTVAGRV